MLSQSDETIAAWKATERTLAVRVTIAGKEYTATDINSLKYDAGAYTGETFAIGSTYSNNIQIEFSHLVEGLKLGDIVEVSIGIKISNKYIYDPLGVFVISSEIKMDRNNNLTTISASDAFCKLEGVYKSKLTYPAKVLDVISEICAMAGVDPNTSELSRLPKLADIPTAIEGQSYRKALGWIAQLYAGYATFDRSGKLTIRTVAEPSYELDPSQYEQSGLTKNEATYKISGIQCQVTTKTTIRDDQAQETTTTLQSGSASGAQIKLENNIMTQARLDDVWQKLKDINFYPFSLNWFGNPAVEAGDWLRLYDKKGNDFIVPNNGYTLEFNGGLSAVSKADQTSGSAQMIGWSGSVMQTIKDLQHRNVPDGTVIFPTSVTEPPKNAHFNDVWFKKNGNSTELWIFERQSDGAGEWQRNDIVNDEIKEEIKRQQAELEELSKNFDDSTWSFQQSLSGIYDAVENAKINTDKAVQQALDQAQKASNDLLNYASGFDSEINLLNEAKDKNKADINKLLTDVNGVKGMYTDLEGNISNFSAGLNGLSGQLKDTNNQLASVKLTADGVVSNFANLQGDIASLKTRANGIEQQLMSKLGSDIFESFKSSTARELKEKLTATDLNGYVKTAEFIKTADGLKASVTETNGRINNLNIQNLVYNSEFENNVEGWSNVGNNPAGTILFANNEWDSFKGSNGLAFRNPNNPTSALMSENKRFKVLSGQKLSASVQLHVTDIITQDCDAGMEIVFYPSEDSGNEISRVSQTTSRVNNISNGFAKLLYVNDVEVPSNAKFATLRLWTYKVGNVIFNQPMVTFSSSYLPYTQDNKSLGVLSEKYAALDIKVNGINSVVANKADASYVDQKADQLQFALTNLSIGGTNLLGGTSTEARSNDAPTSGWVEGAVYNTTQPLSEKQYVLSFEARADVDNQRIGTFLWHGGLGGRNISKKSSTSLGENFTTSDGQTFVTLTTQWKRYWVLYDVDPDNTKKTAIVGRRWADSKPSGKIYVRKVKLETGNKATDWSTAPNELLAQINMQAGRTLIQANKIYLDAESVVFSGKAFIPSAAIASLSADKINGGTINGRTVNVTNLNANNITSGTINGQNLSINLDNGIVQFQRGKIAKTDNSFVINIETGEISSNSNTGAKLYVNRGSLETVNSNNEGIFLSNGALELSSKSLSSASKKYGSISINNHLFEDGYGGIDILGNKAFSIRTEGFLASHLLIGVKYQEVKGAGIIGGLGELQLASEKSIELFAGKASGQDKAEFRPSISIGTTQNGSLSDSIYRAGQNVFIQGQTVALKAQKEINMVAQADTEINIGSPYVGTNAKTIRIGNQYMYQNNELMISWDRVGIGTYPYYYPEPKPDNGLYQGLSKGGSYVNMKKDGNMFVMSDHALILSGGNQGASTQFLDLKSYYPHISIGAYDWAENYTQPMQNSSINIVGWNVDLFAFHEDINLKTFPDHGVHVMGGGMTIDNGLQVHDLHVLGWLGVDGSKNSIVDTSQGKTAINAYETAEYYFGDIAKANTGTSKRVKIMIDPLFLETINTNIDYHVFVSSYDNGYAWVSEMAKDYFVIESNVPNLSVSYELKAKRKQYENVRLDKVDVNLTGGTK
ncbi:hypothetical protein [Ligilactobacillus animalis]|uniref:hypothetical protein n=1 Tax=Ligilactobacillus animalis TaxID=1605 RepID=UPI00384B2704